LNSEQFCRYFDFNISWINFKSRIYNSNYLTHATMYNAVTNKTDSVNVYCSTKFELPINMGHCMELSSSKNKKGHPLSRIPVLEQLIAWKCVKRDSIHTTCPSSKFLYNTLLHVKFLEFYYTYGTICLKNANNLVQYTT